MILQDVIQHSMNIANIDIFHWLLSHYKKASYSLAFSNSFQMNFEEYQKYTNFSIPNDMILSYNNEDLSKEFKELLASKYKAESENVVLTTGGAEANFLVFLSLLNHGDEVLVETPVYSPLRLTPTMIGMKVGFLERSYENKFQFDINSFQDRITNKTKLVVLTNLHNPSGVYTNRKDLIKIAEIAQEKNIHILIDEIFLDGCFLDYKTAYGLPNVIITSSVTKIYGLGGLRCGWIIAPKNIALKCNVAKSHTNTAISDVSLLMISHAFKDAYDQLINRFITLAKPNEEIINRWMKNNAHLLEYVPPSGGIICFPKYHSNISSVDLCTRLLKKYKILVCPGQLFNYEGHFRLSYNIEKQALQEGLELLEQGLEALCK